MARIRNIKPEFFRHEKLQELGPLHMLVFAGLWCQCDKAGNFEWKPKQLKLDILPFVDFDMGSTLESLWISGEILKYSGPDGREYGHVPTFTRHQRIVGTEATNGCRFPEFNGEFEQKKPEGKPWNHLGSIKEATRKQQGSTELGVTELGVTELGVPEVPSGGRVPNPIWDTLVELFAFKAPHPPEEASRIGKSVRFLKAKSATPDEMRRRFSEASKRWAGKSFGPEGLTKHWDSLGAQNGGSNGVVIGDGFITSHGKTKRVLG